jgi:hypothetical protein
MKEPKLNNSRECLPSSPKIDFELILEFWFKLNNWNNHLYMMSNNNHNRVNKQEFLSENWKEDQDSNTDSGSEANLSVVSEAEVL